MILDITLSIILAWGIISGLRKGLILSLTSILGFFFSIYLVSTNESYLLFLLKRFEVPISNNYVFLLYKAVAILAVYILIYIAAYSLKMIIDGIMLNWLDKLLGVMFGILKSYFVINIVLFAIAELSKTFVFFEKILAESQLLNYILDYNPLNMLGINVIESIKNIINSLR